MIESGGQQSSVHKNLVELRFTQDDGPSDPRVDLSADLLLDDAGCSLLAQQILQSSSFQVADNQVEASRVRVAGTSSVGRGNG